MKLVFLKDVPNVANAGDIKEVAEGYGRNFLLPRKLAARATPDELRKLEAQRQAKSRQKSRSEEETRALASTLEAVSLVFKARAGSKERLYGSITTSDIAKELYRATGHKLDKRIIELEEPINHLGSYEVTIRLGRELTPKIKVVVEEAP